MINIIKEIASAIGGVMTMIAFLSLIIKPTRRKLEAWIRKVTEVDHTSKRLDSVTSNLSQQRKDIETLSTKLDKQQVELNNINTKSDIADQKMLTHIQEIDTSINKLDTRVLENERDRIKSELSEYASRCARGLKIYPEEMVHIEEMYSKYSNTLHCNHSGTQNYNTIVDYYKNQAWLKG